MNKYNQHIEAVFEELKDFQTKTVNLAYQQLQKKNRYLIADEVGMGKTKIAKGIIAKSLQKSLSEGKPYRVFYICSNQALANQNLKDLNIFKDEQYIDVKFNRLIFFALKRNDSQQFSLSSLTPSTSFKITTGPGHQQERMLIYTVLSTFPNNPINLQGLKWLLIGDVQSWAEWQIRVNNYHKYNQNNIVEDIPSAYVEKLKQQQIDKRLTPCALELEKYGGNPTNLYDLVVDYSDVLSLENNLENVNKQFPNRYRLLIYLRKILINVSLENLKADLFILDEFQRFKELVQVGKNKKNEAAMIAEEIFNIEGAKTLLLSATPFKMYTTQIDELNDENHYSELTELVSFLYNNNDKVDTFKHLRESFHTQLQSLNMSEDVIHLKEKLEEVYMAVMCRTEKMLVSKDKNSIITSHDKADLTTTKQDLENFVHTDQIFQTIKNENEVNASYSIDYNKSVPFPLSFMEGYQSEKKLFALFDDKKSVAKRLTEQYSNAWINLDHIQNYKLSDYPNSKFRKLVSETVDAHDMWQLLWLPPSLPYYPGMGVYKDKTNLSKTLIFSKWVMVPKMISSLLSYEVERRTVGDSQLMDQKSEYTPPGKARRPHPVLRLKTNDDKPNSMSSFTLLYPSKTLCDMFSINKNITKHIGYKTIRETFLPRIDDALNSLKKYESHSPKPDKNWYWAAPILLDKEHNQNYYQNWIDQAYKYHPIHRRNLNEDKSDNKAFKTHIKEIYDMLVSPQPIQLGTMPHNLNKVLFDIANGSPANCLLRSFLVYFNWTNNYTTLLDKVLDIAYDFSLFFDKPESIVAVRINHKLKDKRLKDNKDNVETHWNLVLRYCVDGNLQSVIDEYCHMLESKNKTIEDLGTALAQGLNIRTSTVKVKGLHTPNTTSIWKSNSKTFDDRYMRCHYAINYGNQNLESDAGVSRAGSIINNFNSPFRPFVLASTSLGQEGLDFHYYCRKIMHWNLPHNPVELEQREGRINRYKGLVIRQNIAAKYKQSLTLFHNVWNEMFDIAEKEECKKGDNPEILPYWFTEPIDGLKIERIVPLLPLSRDVAHYHSLVSMLALYRLTFGQPRQDELLKIIENKNLSNEELSEIYNKLLINLSPYFSQNNKAAKE